LKIPAAGQEIGFDRRYEFGRCAEKSKLLIPVRERHGKSVSDRDKEFQFFGAPPGLIPPVNNPSPASTLGPQLPKIPRVVAWCSYHRLETTYWNVVQIFRP
jgi:hypothetical protein